MLPMILALALFLPVDGDPTLDLAVSLATRAEMHERFTRATLVQTALVNGDLEAARHWARQLGRIAPESEDFADLRGRFGELARSVADAEDLAGAARRTANLANACGACHELHAVRPDRFQSSVGPPGGEALADRMARHVWAADRMWEGLVGRSEASWREGAGTLAEAPLTAEQLGLDAPRVEHLARDVVTLAREALDTHRWSGRAAVYGRFLALCADCHASYRGTP